MLPGAQRPAEPEGIRPAGDAHAQRRTDSSKEQLLLKAWGYDSDAEDNNVEVYISFLRRKLALIRSAVQIKTVRMVGYYLEEAK
ncbi:MAG: winged helix-turn-helix domain-containing protein [Oscillospiraceae bacterium]